jgi:hypothetical protein
MLNTWNARKSLLENAVSLGLKQKMKMKSLLVDLEVLFPVGAEESLTSSFLRGASDDDEAIEETEPFVGLLWTRLDAGFWNEHRFSIGFLTPEAICYYLPSIIFASLLGEEDVLCVVEDLIDRLKGSVSPMNAAGFDSALVNLGFLRLTLMMGWISFLLHEKNFDQDLGQLALARLSGFAAEAVAAG